QKAAAQAGRVGPPGGDEKQGQGWPEESGMHRLSERLDPAVPADCGRRILPDPANWRLLAADLRAVFVGDGVGGLELAVPGHRALVAAVLRREDQALAVDLGAGAGGGGAEMRSDQAAGNVDRV